jgi:hypothetical protein
MNTLELICLGPGKLPAVRKGRVPTQRPTSEAGVNEFSRRGAGSETCLQNEKQTGQDA